MGGVNAFTDLTSDEFVNMYTGLKQPAAPWGELPYLGRHNYSGAALSASVDWTSKGAVTAVKKSGTMWFLLVFLHDWFIGRSMGNSYWQACVTERAAVC